MISFEHQLSHVIFSHCKYSLKAGRGADVSYDFVALEKHVLDRFVRGKPLIICDIPIMSYRSDVLVAETFTKIRKKIKPQVNIVIKVVIKFISYLFQISHHFHKGKKMIFFVRWLENRVFKIVLT